MAHKKMYATAPMRYGTRMLKAGEPVTMNSSEVSLYTAMGRFTAKKPAKAKPEPAAPVDALTELRAAYHAKFDRRPYHGWGADALRERIASE